MLESVQAVDRADPVDHSGRADRRRPVVHIRPALSAADRARVAAVRHQAWARHVPAMAEALREPEPEDADDANLVLLAESAEDGGAIGTIRIHDNGATPLPLEASVTLPWWLRDAALAEAMRLAVVPHEHQRLARDALFKAAYRHCLDEGIEWMVVTARSPIDRIYESLHFGDVFDDGRRVPVRHAGNLPHRVMALSVAGAARTWAARRHPLLPFMLDTA